MPMVLFKRWLSFCARILSTKKLSIQVRWKSELILNSLSGCSPFLAGQANCVFPVLPSSHVHKLYACSNAPMFPHPTLPYPQAPHQHGLVPSSSLISTLQCIHTSTFHSPHLFMPTSSLNSMLLSSHAPMITCFQALMLPRSHAFMLLCPFLSPSFACFLVAFFRIVLPCGLY